MSPAQVDSITQDDVADPADPTPQRMRVARISRIGPVSETDSPVRNDTDDVPVAGAGEVLIRVSVCGVCHTEIDEIEGRTPPARLPMTPGHQVVGTIVREGSGCGRGLLGQRVGVAWIWSACGVCRWCRAGFENLCPEFVATGRDAPGGYAEYMLARESFVFPIPDQIPDAEASPLLCAGAVGYRSLMACGLIDGESIGFTGYGASAHLVHQMSQALYPGSPVHVFARSPSEREFALKNGACWAGDTIDSPPRPLDAIIDTTPAWLPVVSALDHLAPRGRLVINAIRKEADDRDVLAEIEYERHLWQEKSVRSVANVTRQDVTECLQLAARIRMRPQVTEYPLEQAGDALKSLRRGHVRGAKVLRCRHG